MTVIVLLAAGVTAAEPLTREAALQLWRSEGLIVRTSPEWRHRMFDAFPVTALITLHAGADDVEGFSRRHPGITVERVMGPLPLLVLSVPTREAMLAMLRDPGVRYVEPNFPLELQMDQALPMTNPLPAGQGGTGTSIAIIDTGLLSTSPIATSGRIRATITFNSCTNQHSDTQDRNGHGTVMASIAAAAAPQAGIIVLKAVSCSGALDPLRAHDAQIWVYDNAVAYNIVAVSMSYAGAVKYSGTCNTSMAAMMGHLLSRGVVPVTATGNTGWKTGLPEPACAPSALAVGMIASRTGGNCLNWDTEWVVPGTSFKITHCIQYALNAGQIPALSNSGNRVALIAPGGVVVSGGWHEPLFGTSLAAPFVAGGVAVAQAIYKRPGSTMLAAMKAHPGSMLIKDTGNNLSRPLIDITRLAADTTAARPPGYVPGPPGTPPGGSSPATVATTTTAPVTLLTPPPAVIGGCSSCHGI